jgi:hypothetical protein
LVDYEDWLDSTTFYSRKWSWKTVGNPMISEGGIGADGKFAGLMPLFPVSIALVRNVKLVSQWKKETRDGVNKAIQGGGGLNFGFFSVGGNYENRSDTKNSRVITTDTSIEIPDPQIIGWFCDVLPKSPDPEVPQP